jgi:hypothetical protein
MRRQVSQEGFEPPTFWFVAKYSIQLSYWDISTGVLGLCYCALGGNRTPILGSVDRCHILWTTRAEHITMNMFGAPEGIRPPPASTVVTLRSIQLSYGRVLTDILSAKSANDRSRTYMYPLLFQLVRSESRYIRIFVYRCPTWIRTKTNRVRTCRAAVTL